MQLEINVTGRSYLVSDLSILCLNSILVCI